MSHNYLAHTDGERAQMLASIGFDSIADVFAAIPSPLKQFELNLPAALSEVELLRHLNRLAQANKPASQHICLLGAGAYQHFSPSALDLLISRSEFLTAYTPYQAEISQGTLQTIYEFQSSLCALTGMDIANASTYEGASATAEAGLMACRITHRQTLLVSDTVHPEYRQVLETYLHNAGFSVHTGKSHPGATSVADFEDMNEPAALVVQYPNFLGHIEPIDVLADWIHQRGGLLIVVMNDPTVLGVLEAPGHLGADIVAGEAQACGNSLSFGGPYVGFLATREKFIRQMPGRMSGKSKDADGHMAFTLVLQTREQHIRREKATSNICTNQGLNALIATIWFTLLGKQGLAELANICVQRAHYCAEQIERIPGFRIATPTPFFHEFVVRTDYDLSELFVYLNQHQCVPGVALSRWYPDLQQHFLVTVTEMNPVEDLDTFIGLLQQFAETHR